MGDATLPLLAFQGGNFQIGQQCDRSAHSLDCNFSSQDSTPGRGRVRDNRRFRFFLVKTRAGSSVPVVCTARAQNVALFNNVICRVYLSIREGPMTSARETYITENKRRSKMINVVVLLMEKKVMYTK